MARTKGSANFAGSLEVLAGAPIDARTVVNTKADLLAEGSYPYKYIGMIVSVKELETAFMLISADTTKEASWKDLGAGGDGSGVVEGYFYNDKFYKEVAHTTEITGESKKLYLSVDSSKLYRYNGSKFVVVGADIDTEVYIPGGSVAFASLPVLSANVSGFVYNITDDFTTTNNFIEGAGINCKAGTDVAVINSGTKQDPVYKYNIFNVGGSAGSLGEAITSAIAVGGIAAGTTYAKGTDYDTLWDNLLNPTLYPSFVAPSASLDGSGSKILETGSTLNATLTVTFSRGTIDPAYGTAGYRSGEATGYSLNSGTSQAENTFSQTVSASNKSFKAAVTYAAGEQPKDSKGKNYSTALAAGEIETNTVSYEFVDALWANTSNIGTVAKLTLVSKGAKQKDFVFPAQTVENPEVFDVPASWTVSAVQVKNDLSGAYENASDQFTVTNVTHDDAAGNSVDYKRYTFNLGYPTGARTVRIKWN